MQDTCFRRPRLLPTLLAVALFTLSGCVSYSADQSIVHMRVPTDTPLGQIKPGYTQVTWLLDYLGEPDAVSHARGHNTVWQYENIHRESRHLRAFPVLGLHSQTQTITVYNFAVEQDLIVQYWKENN